MAETYDAKIFQRGGVAMVRYPDGDEAVLADVMRYMNPGMEYDQATGDPLYAMPPPAEAGENWKPAQPYAMPDTSAQREMQAEPGLLSGIPELGRMATSLGNINQMLNPVESVGQSMAASRRMLAPNTPGMDRVAAFGDMLSGVAGVTAPVAAAARAGTPAAMALMEGLLGWSPAATAAKDTASTIARTVAERANQRGPVPTMGSNFGNLLGDVGEASTGIRAYHNSPHDFNRFSMSQIGTGEGAQAYGHGMYFAESPSVSGRGGDYWKQFFNKMPSGPERTATGAMYANKFDTEKAASQLEANVRYHADRAKPGKYADGPEIEEGNRLLAEENQQALDMIRSGQIVGPRTYEVNINADPNKFLDWDKPLSEQPEVANLLGYSDAARIAADRKKLYGQFSAPKSLKYDDLFGPLSANEKAAAQQLSAMPEPWNEMTGKDAWFRASKRKYVVEGPDGRLGPGGNTYEEALQVAGGDANKVRAMSDPAAPARAEFMREAGIPGIKYLDQGSRGAGAGSSNYVVFDENLISIVKKYGIAGAAAMLGVSAVDVEEAMARGQPPQGLLSMGSK